MKKYDTLVASIVDILNYIYNSIEAEKTMKLIQGCIYPMKIFEYGEKEITYLKKKGKKLSEAIDIIGKKERMVIPDLFEALINSIVSQQISNKAADTVMSDKDCVN